MQFFDKAKAMEDQLTEWRRDIHMHPELGFEETRTARKVADTLRGWGMEVEVGVGITGVVARIGDSSEGRSIGIRADMDALPIDEDNDVPYKSQTPGIMHACGHDAHTAILLGVAKMLNEMEDRPRGEIRFLFQPSEEKWDKELKSGATRMIDDNALEDLDSVIALHVSSFLPSGTVVIGDGHMLAAVDSFTAVIKGEGCHGASPHMGIDPVWMQAQVINAIQAIRSRWLTPLAPSVITVGSIHGGSAPNVIPHEVTLIGTIRSYDEEIRDQLHEELATALSLVKTWGGDYTLDIERGYPALYNDPNVADVIRMVGTETVGDENLPQAQASMGAEDFAFMTKKAPGAMFFLGAKMDEVNRPHHSPIFDIDEKALPVGAAVLAETAVRLLKGEDVQ